jgi:hypothetical protein
LTADTGLQRPLGNNRHVHFRPGLAHPWEYSAKLGGRAGPARVARELSVNFQVTILKVLVSYPGGFASLADVKRDVAILVTSGRDWSDRTTRLAARIPGLEICAQGLVERKDGGWRITDAGRSALDLMEKSAAPEVSLAQVAPPEPSPAIRHPVSLVVAGPVRRRMERRRRRRRPNRGLQAADAS